MRQIQQPVPKRRGRAALAIVRQLTLLAPCQRVIRGRRRTTAVNRAKQGTHWNTASIDRPRSQRNRCSCERLRWRQARGSLRAVLCVGANASRSACQHCADVNSYDTLKKVMGQAATRADLRLAELLLKLGAHAMLTHFAHRLDVCWCHDGRRHLIRHRRGARRLGQLGAIHRCAGIGDGISASCKRPRRCPCDWAVDDSAGS